VVKLLKTSDFVTRFRFYHFNVRLNCLDERLEKQNHDKKNHFYAESTKYQLLISVSGRFPNLSLGVFT